jgi:predicted lysophospholipase L1 biosynthesis ABC-type transport system permease subunit
VAPAAFEAPGETTRAVPAPGEAWVDAALLESLNLKVGDPLLLGDASRFTIARASSASSRTAAAGFANFSPRVMFNAGRPGRHRAGAAGEPVDLPRSRSPVTEQPGASEFVATG